ncbi:MAG: hypothetical protein J0I67_21035, partial [Bosea sp.]|nr:hypothetical protein [Bosea sp. (in: a-proteobacteria)]
MSSHSSIIWPAVQFDQRDMGLPNMIRIYGSGCAAFAICLGLLQPAAAEINAETDARAFIVREAEIKRAQEAPEAGRQQARHAPDGAGEMVSPAAQKSA